MKCSHHEQLVLFLHEIYIISEYIWAVYIPVEFVIVSYLYNYTHVIVFTKLTVPYFLEYIPGEFLTSNKAKAGGNNQDRDIFKAGEL